jgi:PAT family beta-lactamase induction signal transducer AmpG
MDHPSPRTPGPWAWIPTLYFGQGIPYVVVMTLSVIMYKNLGVSNTDIALYTSWLYLPWVIKPLWSPFVELIRTKRFWIVGLQLLIGALLALVGLALPLPDVFRWTLVVFWLMAFSSATHDIAADGFYMLALPEKQQAAFVGVRSTFYRVAMISGQGGLVYLAGRLEVATGNVPLAWSIIFFVLGGFFVTLSVYHRFLLPRPASDRPAIAVAGVPPMREFWQVFRLFLGRRDILAVLGFLLFFRFAEAQLVKLAAPFLLDTPEAGGLGIATAQVGVVYGTVGVLALTLGGLLGGWAVSRKGLRFWLWPMVLAINVPNVVYVLLALFRPGDITVISAAVAFEQFGYGFGFAAYLLFMMMVADGPHKTAHYALCTGFMALGMMLPGMASGWLQEQLGYLNFFVWICLATLPSFIAAAFVRITPGYGMKQG